MTFAHLRAKHCLHQVDQLSLIPSRKSASRIQRRDAAGDSSKHSSSVWPQALRVLVSPASASRRATASSRLAACCASSSSNNSEQPEDGCMRSCGSADDTQQEAPQQHIEAGGSSSGSSDNNSLSSSSSSNAGGAHSAAQLEEHERHQPGASWPEPQQQQQQQPPSPDQLQLQYLKHQAMKLQALEDYQRLMAQHPSSSSSSKGNKDSNDNEETDDIPVLDAALLIAKHAHPDLDAQEVKQQLDELAAEVERSLPPGVRYPLRIIKEINRVLYEVHGFKGNMEDYYHPDNSCINRVLQTKKGIPISLSLVYMEVASRVGLKLAGVNLPAHFMIRPQVEGMEWMVDAFNGGELTALEDAEEVLGRLMGYQVKLDPRFVRGETPYFSGRQLLLRLLNNLRQIYMTLNMAEEALSIVRYMRATAPAGSLPELQRDEGMCLYGMGRLAEAAEVLTDYLKSGASERADTALVTAVLDRIRERAAEAAAAAAAVAASGSISSREGSDESAEGSNSSSKGSVDI